MASITPINVKGVVKNHAPRVEEKKTVKDWFVDEQIELDFGEDTGRPDQRILLQREYITKFLENGWTIDAVLYTSDGGVWESTSENTNYSESRDEDYVTEKPEVQSGGYVKWNKTTNTVNIVDANTVQKAMGAAYWCAFQRVRLKRRRMQPEKVMQSMIDSFTSEYNSGRDIDNKRLNEVMSLYAIVLDRNEKEANNLLNQAINQSPTSFLDTLYKSTWVNLSAASGRAYDAGAAATEDAVNDVNRQFDALVSQTKAQMITNGTYNNTVWPTTLAGIERQRAAALVKAKSEAAQIGVNAEVAVASAKSSAASVFLSAQSTIKSAIDNRIVSASDMRNTVVKWMLDYLGSREEVYPELEEILGVAQNLGFSVGSAGNVL